jgi:hypothetical protein
MRADGTSKNKSAPPYFAARYGHHISSPEPCASASHIIPGPITSIKPGNLGIFSSLITNYIQSIVDKKLLRIKKWIKNRENSAFIDKKHFTL